MNHLKISIIVPIFQSEKYLADCLSSLLQQDIDNYEILCINDGSLDSSEDIVFRFQKETDKIHYFYQNNQGVSSARNRGIEFARGEYLMFVDSDDMIRANSLKYLYKKAKEKQCDILVFGGITDVSFRSPEWVRQALYTKNADYKVFHPDILLKELGAQPSVCNKLIKRECIQGIHFPENISIAEDMAFLFELFPAAQSISFTKKKIYKYRVSNIDSAMHKTHDASRKHMENHLAAAETIIANWKKKELIEKSPQQFLNWLTNFLRAPYATLDENARQYYSAQLETIYASLNSVNLLIADVCSPSSFLPKRICSIIDRDIKKYGLYRGTENLVHKLITRNKTGKD